MAVECAVEVRAAGSDMVRISLLTYLLTYLPHGVGNYLKN